MLPAFGFLAGDDWAVAWLGLVGRVGDVVGYLPIMVQAVRYAESTAGSGGGPRTSLPRENPWLFWKCCERDVAIMVDGIHAGGDGDGGVIFDSILTA